MTTVSTTFSTEERHGILVRKTPHKMLQVNKNTGFARFYSIVSRPALSNGARTAEKSYWKHKHGAKKTEKAVSSKSHNAVRQRQQPVDGIQHESEQRNRSAQNK